MSRTQKTDGTSRCFAQIENIKRQSLINNTPQLWKELCKSIFIKCSGRKEENNLIFIKAWNEWGEGNYLEPDSKWGKQYLEVTREAIFGE